MHWMSARAVHGRGLTRPEWRAVVLDGFPLVAAGTVAVVVLLVEGVLGSTRTGPSGSHCS